MPLEARQVSNMKNKIYAAIFEELDVHETRGFNAHSRAQTITERWAPDIIIECNEWIALQHPRQTEEDVDAKKD